MKTRKAQEQSDEKRGTSDHTPTPYPIGKVDQDALMTILLGNDYRREAAEAIVRAVNSHDELVKAAKNALNVLAGLVTGDLKEVKADSPALQMLRNAIAKAEASTLSQGEK